MKATKLAWARILTDILTLTVESGVEFRNSSGSLLEAPNDIWTELKENKQVSVRFSNTKRKENGET